MAGRTFAIGDIHGDVEHLLVLLSRLPTLDADDTLVFLGDYVDRGPSSRRVVDYLRELPRMFPARVVCLRGNHEDAWLHVLDRGWPEFIEPPGNGCRACQRSYSPAPTTDEELEADRAELLAGRFFPPEHVTWMRGLPFWYEDDHAIYVHAGLPEREGRWLHPREVGDPRVLLWVRNHRFFREYRGKSVVFGHTVTGTLPPELSCYTPEDPTDLWAGENLYAIDTGCGKGGFLTGFELPRLIVYESR